LEGLTYVQNYKIDFSPGDGVAQSV